LCPADRIIRNALFCALNLRLRKTDVVLNNQTLNKRKAKSGADTMTEGLDQMLCEHFSLE
jgi:hypothetical protein